MKTIFKVGKQLKFRDNPYVWNITEIKGKKIKMESYEGDSLIKADVTMNDLKTLIQLGYYKLI